MIKKKYLLMAAMLAFFNLHGVQVGADDKLNEQLIQATKCGQAPKVSALLAKGADPNTRSGAKGDTPLLIAAWHGHGKIATALLKKGAAVNAAEQSEWRLNPLLVASACGRVEFVTVLLGAEGIDVNAADKAGATAWTYAAFAEGDALTEKIRELLTAKRTRVVGGDFTWLLQAPAYACRENSELTSRFEGKNCR